VRPRRLWGADGNVVAAVLATLAVISPLVISASFLFMRPLAQLPRAYDMCAVLPDNAVVLWLGQARAQAMMATRTFCDVPVLGYGGSVFNKSAPSARFLQQFSDRATQQGLVPVVGLYGHQRALLGRTSATLSVVHTSTTTDLERTLLRPPYGSIEQEISVLLGMARHDGAVVPLGTE
jgi:hypothetical protein